MRQYPAVDLAKLVAAVLVIAVHTDPLSSYSWSANYLLVNVAARLAVPLFFLSAGFFLQEKLRQEPCPRRIRAEVRRYLSRIGRLYGFWTVVYLPYAIYAWAILYRFSPGYWGTFLQRSLFQGSYYTLWFLPALLLAIPCAVILLRRLSGRMALLLCLSLYVIGALGQAYSDLLPSARQLSRLLSGYDRLFLTTRNGLFFGLPFVCLGMWLSREQIKLSRRMSLPLFVLSSAMLVGEAWSLRGLSFSRGTGMWLSLPPVIVSLWLLLLSVRLPAGRWHLRLRWSSTWLYVSHGLLIILYSMLMPPALPANSLLRFLFVLLGSLALQVLATAAVPRWRMR